MKCLLLVTLVMMDPGKNWLCGYGKFITQVSLFCKAKMDSIPSVDFNSFHNNNLQWIDGWNLTVNARLIRELALRESRIVSKEEILASKFPPRSMCPKCFLDKDMETWDPKEVFNFLEMRYWPSNGVHHHRNLNGETGTPLSSKGLFVICIPLLYIPLILLNQYIRKSKASEAQKNR